MRRTRRLRLQEWRSIGHHPGGSRHH